MGWLERRGEHGILMPLEWGKDPAAGTELREESGQSGVDILGKTLE
jgi:hypothetical protein